MFVVWQTPDGAGGAAEAAPGRSGSIVSTTDRRRYAIPPDTTIPTTRYFAVLA